MAIASIIKANGAVPAPLRETFLITLGLVAYHYRCDEFLDMVDMAMFTQGGVDQRQSITYSAASISIGHVLTTGASMLSGDVLENFRVIFI